MDQDFQFSDEMQIVIQLNRGLMDQNADQVLRMLCLFMTHHRLTASRDVVDQIPLKREH